MEKNIRKRVCRSVAVLIAVLVVTSGYGFFFSSSGYCHKMKEAAKLEYREKQLLWRKSENMTEKEMLKDMTLMANGDTVLVCWGVNMPIAVYRDFIHGAAQPKRFTWAYTRYWYMKSLSDGREWMREYTKDRSYRASTVWDNGRHFVQEDTLKDYRKEKPLQIEVKQNALYPALGKPSDEAFEKWIREYKSGFAFPQINNSKRWIKIPFLE